MDQPILGAWLACMDRQAIMKDYHFSTLSGQPEWEMAKVDPADYPGVVIVQHHAAAAEKPAGMKAGPLYTKVGRAHVVEFFGYLDKEYGGVAPYLEKERGVGPEQLAKLCSPYPGS
jgi:protein-tyrosine phosphatase